MKTRNFKHSTKAGFTLIELALVLAIAGVILGIGAKGFRIINEQVMRRTTEQRMDGVAKAFSRYVEQNLFMPCPAPPPTAGTPISGVARAACANMVDSTGLLPYETLGLRAENARDGYGRYFTYAVNPMLATNATVQSASRVMRACRLDYIWVQRAYNLRATSRTPRKARFCCFAGGTPNDDLRVMSDAPAVPGAVQISPRRGPIDADNINTRFALAYPTPATPQWSRTETAAFVLISHGRNGYGAYGPNGRIPGPATWSPQESENANDDNVFVSAPFSGAAARFFDDTVIWRTQSQIVNALGWNSCTRS